MPGSLSSSAHATSTNMRTLGDQIGSSFRSIAQHWQPTVDIIIDNEHGADSTYVNSYSTMDSISGCVSITTGHQTRFDEVEIAFVGMTQVYVDRLTTTPSMSGRTEATHRFLTLKQPLGPADYPSPRILETGKTYTFPFVFTIPTHLLPRACTHSVKSDHVRNTHCSLPPSLGDPALAGFGGTLLDDLAPAMSKIAYCIRVRITSNRDIDGSCSLIADKMRKIRVKPRFEEQPPLNVDADPEYRIRQNKVIKKGLFKGKLGTLTAQSMQPKPLVIPGARTTDNAPINTRAKVILRFDPTDESIVPPRLGSLQTKLKVSTFFASSPRHTFPTRQNLGYDLTQGAYSENISLSTMCIASAQWTKHDASVNPSPDLLIRRDSGISDCSTDSGSADAFATGVLHASKNYKGGSFYTAQVVVPVTLPMNKNFIPTFHSCLISRVYALSLQLSAHAPGVSDPSLHLKVPIQVCAEGSDAGNANERARSLEAVTMREADSMFVPRSVAPPSETDLPPQYATFAAPMSSGAGVAVVG